MTSSSLSSAVNIEPLDLEKSRGLLVEAYEDSPPQQDPHE